MEGVKKQQTMEEEKQQNTTYFVFQVNEEAFTVPVLRVANVLELMTPSRIPETPEYLEGIVNIRGELLPVIDSRIKFGMKKTTRTADACIIVLEIYAKQDNFRIGLIVDKARDVIEVKKDQVERVPDMGLNLNPDYVKGVINRNEEIILMLDIDEIFSQKEVTEINQIKENQKE